MKCHQQRLDTGLSGGLAGQVGKLKWWWWVALPVRERERDRFHQHAEDMLSIMGRETDLVSQQSYLATGLVLLCQLYFYFLWKPYLDDLL